MKKFVVAIIIIATLMFKSCEPAATFDNPQPDKVKAMTSFTEHLQGKYLAADSASVVTITDKMIQRHYDFEVKQPKDSLSSSYILMGRTLIDQENGTREKVLVKGDTVILDANWIDTLFSISPDNILKRYKGYYFLNKRFSPNAWEVKKLSLKRGVLAIGDISTKDDIQKLRDISQSNADTISTTFKLTRRQFKRFVKQEGFGEQETFYRMTKNGR